LNATAIVVAATTAIVVAATTAAQIITTLQKPIHWYCAKTPLFLNYSPMLYMLMLHV